MNKEGTVSWESPSNIAIVKYWGKHGNQLPRNPSVSFTLQNAKTTTEVSYKISDSFQLSFYFEDKENEPFGKKVESFLKKLVPEFPFLAKANLTIHSSNSFPHSAGIASSASSMSALALCLCSIDQQLNESDLSQDAFLQRASHIARLGSGSACRSLYPGLSVWGTSASVPNSSDEFGIPFESAVHPVFKSFHDDILIVSKEEKSVSSRAGHALMEGNPFAVERYKQANERLHRLVDILKTGDVNAFGKIAEDEALSLHALMMLSDPSYLLVRPNTIAIIEKIREFRAQTSTPVYFSLDAGPNIHLLYPDDSKTAVQEFLQKELVPLCQDEMYIADQVGTGPKRLK